MKYQAIIRKMLQVPWAIMPAKLAEITDFMAAQAAGEKLTPEEVAEVTQSARSSQARQVSKTAVIPIMGTIVNRETSLTRTSGLASVKGIQAQLTEALNDGEVSSILLDIDSPGGTVEGIADLAASIRKARSQKPILASVDGLGASAAYYLASQATRLAVTQTSEVGSIGVIMAHQDFSQAMEKEGIHTTLVTAGKYKGEFNPFSALSEEAVAEMQAQVDYYYDLFLTDVAKGRGVSKAQVRKEFGQGRLVRPKQALAKGMIDAIETGETTLAQAVIAGAKSARASQVSTIRDFETLLRENGFSRSEARQFAASGFSPDGQWDADQETDQWDAGPDGQESAASESIIDIARKHLAI